MVRDSAIGRIAAGTILLAGLATFSSGEDPGEQLKERRPLIETNFTIAGYSKYIWRGSTLVDGPVLQPCLTFTRKGLAVTAFASFSTTSDNGYITNERAKNRWSEVDLLVDYSFTRGPVTWSLGYNYYSQPNTGYKRSQEAYVAASLAEVALAPKLMLYTGLDEYHGYYVSLSGSHSVPTKLAKAENVEICASLGYGDAGHNEWLYGSRKSGFADAQVTVSLPVDLGKGWTITPSLSHSTVMDKGLLSGPDRSKSWMGLAIGFSF